MTKDDKKSAQSGRKEALDVALGQIEKEYGKGAIMKISEAESVPVDVIPTGSLSLDLALGVGGLPRGRVVEIYGPEMSGKSSLSLHIIREAQILGGICAYIDAEHAFDSEYAKAIGVKIDDLLVSQPDTGEQALSITETLVRSNAVDVIIIDSVAALVPRAEIEGEMGEAQIGLQARLMSSALRKLAGSISKSKTIVVFINQLRMKIGVFFGSPETTPGGLALKFYSSVRLDARRIEQIKKGDEVIGNRVRVKVAKNKVSAPFKIAEFDLIFTEGISREGDILDLGVERGIIQKSGSWFLYGQRKIGQGRETAKEYLKENTDLAKEIEKKIRENPKVNV
ncbi:MAG: recombinase RecA [Candidatus Berkelbacteria bacterium]|nr:recombinase RecA [Candidatus Berkelbacteria bacterium]